MNEIYFPSCNFSAASPEAAKRIRAYLKEQMPIAGCCRTEKQTYPVRATAVYFCQACRETIEARPDFDLNTENLFVYINRDNHFPWSDYSGMTVTVQDCWRDREHPEIFDAVRLCLEKMNITIIEMEENREQSVYCGDLHFEPKKQENIELIAPYADTSFRNMPTEEKGKLMLEQTEKYPCPLVVCYCNTCIRGLNAAREAGWQGRGVHLLELMMKTFA